MTISSFTNMDIPEIPNSDIETPLTDEKLQIEEMKLTKKDGNFEHIPSTLQTATKTHSDQSLHKIHNAQLIPVLVDGDCSTSVESGDPRVFEYHHEDKHSESTNRSIFEVHHHHHHLHSFGNERPGNFLALHKKNEYGKQANKTPVKSTTGPKFLPNLVEANKENNKQQAEKNISDIPKPNKKGKKSRQLYDYNNPSYLEHSRRTRRRKQSEVDIEIGLRLSRYVQQPYEGCVDKYSKKYQQRVLRERRSRSKSDFSTGSADNSPLGSSSEQINSPRPSRLREYDEEQLRSYLWLRRGVRRRSISSSPPLLRKSDNSDFLSTQSQTSSPALSPTPSAGPSSPALGRYRKTTFSTILNSAKKRDEFESRFHPKHSLLPDIHQHSHQKPDQTSTNLEEELLSQSLPATEITLLHFRNRSGTFSDFRNSKNSADSNAMSKTEHPPKKVKSIPVPAAVAPGPRPSSPKRVVLVNSNMPSASPTFQRAMQGLHGPNESGAVTGKGSADIRRKPAILKSQQSRTRMLAAGGKQKVLKRSPTSTCGSRPNISGHHVSFGETSTAEQLLPYNENSDDDIIEEMRDKLTNLKTHECPPMMPSKSILKNRRRSIDDLDVGTKKGLAMYLKTKQKAAQLRRRNGHFTH